MNYLVVLIVDNPEDCLAVLESWENLGVYGVTILESTGLGRLRNSGLLENVPLMPSLQDILGPHEVQHRTLLSVVDTQVKVDEMVAAVQGIIGNLNEPNTGFMFVVPVTQVFGLRNNPENQE